MSLVAAQAVIFPRSGALVAVFVTGVALAVPVGVLTRGALVGGCHTASVGVQSLVLPAAGAGMRPRAGEAGAVTVWR